MLTEDTNQRANALFSSLAGTTIEWYEFFVYGIAAALALGKVFFPKFDPLVSSLLSMSTFAVAFIARPLGAAIFGHLGDKLGRRPSLIITLTLMGGSTFLIGLLPTYESVGVAAPVLLIVLRLLQGISLGGEYSGAVLMSVEHASLNKRGLFGSIVNTGSALGLILANLVFLALSGLDESSFLSWGWRIPFILSAVLVLVGMIIRSRVSESPDFEKTKFALESHQTAPLIEIWHNHKRSIVLLALGYIGSGTYFYTGSVFSLSYASHLNVTRGTMLLLIMISYAILAIGMVFFGWLSDRVGKKRIFVISALWMVLMPFVWFSLLDSREFATMLAGFVLMILPFSANYGVMPTFYADNFPASVRFSGMAIGYTLGTILGSATAPLVGTFLLHATDGWHGIAAFMAVASLLSAIAGALMASGGVATSPENTMSTLSRS